MLNYFLSFFSDPSVWL